ncbi:MAG TPA: enoyl-CoA hydratase-related protein [Kofleriaceae bacterium]|nr:enoyl-CoA hydratase-related protein [Kofleriaceae bacterium]
MTAHIQVTTADRVTTLRFSRVDKKNAITVEMYAALQAGLEAAANDSSVRAVIFAGAPECFTAGNDLADFMRVAQTGEGPRGALGFLHALATFEKPVVAAVSGVAIGIGTTMLLHCDLVYASPSARFKTPFVDLALVPEAGSSLLLPALVGARRAAQLLMLGEQIDAQTALDWGLINGVAPDADAAALAAARKLAACAPSALRTTKALSRRVGRDHVLEQMRIEGDAFSDRLRSPEALEALQAFMQRRAPDFSKF